MDNKIVDLSILKFKSYSDYLRSFMTKDDLFYLNSAHSRSQLVKLGYRTTKMPYTRAEFQDHINLAKATLQPKYIATESFSRFMTSQNKDPVLLEIKKRELPILSKSLSTIVFTMYTSQDGSEISGYLDLGMSFANTIRKAHEHADWKGIFEGVAHLRPMPHHLSYYNSRQNIVHHTDSDNFKVIHDNRYGLMFMHKGDHKFLPIGDPKSPFAKNMTRTYASSPKHGAMIFYDHIVRKKV